VLLASGTASVAESFHALFQDRARPLTRPWRGLDDIELATLDWIDWCNHPTAASVVLVSLGDVRLPRGLVVTQGLLTVLRLAVAGTAR
jgi:hypothetical protein